MFRNSKNYMVGESVFKRSSILRFKSISIRPFLGIKLSKNEKSKSLLPRLFNSNINDSKERDNVSQLFNNNSKKILNRLKTSQIIKQFLGNPQYVYKLCDDKWIVVLKRQSQDKINENIVDQIHSKYQSSDSLLVEMIININTLENEKSISSFENKFMFTDYTTGSSYFSTCIWSGDESEKFFHDNFERKISYFKTLEGTVNSRKYI